MARLYKCGHVRIITLPILQLVRNTLVAGKKLRRRIMLTIFYAWNNIEATQQIDHPAMNSSKYRIATDPKTPYSNTALPRQSTKPRDIEVGLDFLVVTGKTNITALVDAVWGTFGTNFDWQNSVSSARGRVYDVVVKSAQGIELAFNRNTNGDRACVYRLSIPGKPLNHVKEEKLTQFLQYLYEIKARATRVDWRIDLFSGELAIDDCVSACQRGDFRGAREWREIRSSKRGKQIIGRTVYIGSTNSSKMVRIYDKGAEQGVEYSWTRYEVQWREKHAAVAFKQILGSSDRRIDKQNMSNLAIGTIGFVGRENQVLSRCPILKFWSSFVEKVGVAKKITVEKLQTMISDKIHWVEHQVSSTIALISKAKGFDQTINWIESLIREKVANLSSRNQAYLDTWRDRIRVESADLRDWQIMRDWERV